jgi:hypothetical protein
MSPRLNVVIVVARCSRSKKYFGIRFEARSTTHWIADWAFALKEAAVKKEGYERNTISGKLTFGDEYPGCPHCENKRLLKCGCGKVSCWDGRDGPVICPWCGSSGEVVGKIDSLNAGEDR